MIYVPQIIFQNSLVAPKSVQEKLAILRENKARFGATLEGLQIRKKDLVDNIKNDLNMDEKDLLNKDYLKAENPEKE